MYRQLFTLIAMLITLRSFASFPSLNTNCKLNPSAS
jgi:hypothetical protein